MLLEISIHNIFFPCHSYLANAGFYGVIDNLLLLRLAMHSKGMTSLLLPMLVNSNLLLC